MATEKDILKKLSEPIPIEDIDFRIQSISTSGWATILAYKSARIDMNRLDEVCGMDWQNKYELIDGQLFCFIGVKTDEEWIWRSDVGIESQTESTKGRASDAFKRAGFRFGIGRELYGYPRIFLQLKSAEDVSGNNKPEFKVKSVGQGEKKIGTSDWGLQLDKWTWSVEFEKDSTKIKHLVGKDQNGDVRFDSNKEFNSLPKKQKNTTQTPSAEAKAPAETKTPAKPKMKKEVYDQALKSEKLDVLKQSLTKYDLTATQLNGISKRIKELNEKKS